MAQPRDSKLIRAEFKDAYIDDPTVNEILVDADRTVGDPLDPLEEKDEFRRRSYFQHVGFYSLPRSGIDPDQMIFLRSDNTYVAIASEGLNIYKPPLNHEGDAAIYADGQKWVAAFADGQIQAQNNNGVVRIQPDGTIELANINVGVQLNPDGSATIENINGKIELAADGTVDINGGNLTVDP